MVKETTDKNTVLPKEFTSILWSYDISRVKPDRDRKLIIVNTINYGNLDHWRWLIKYYGEVAIREVLKNIPVSELRFNVRRLVSIVFNIKHFNNASRGAHRK